MPIREMKHKEIIKIIPDFDDKACPYCKENDWAWDGAIKRLPLNMNILIGFPSLEAPVLMLVCQNCNNIQMFLVPSIEKEEEK